MTVEQRVSISTARPVDGEAAVVPVAAFVQVHHLLRVAGTVAQEANGTWADLWAQFKPLVTGGGMIVPQGGNGFVPECGWPELLEKIWLLKHYLDSVERVCQQRW